MNSNYFNNKVVAVSGASGFLGSNYVKKLLKLGAKVKASQHIRKVSFNHPNLEIIDDVDFTKLDDSIKFVDGAEIVIHSAGNIAHPTTVSKDIQISLQNINTISNMIDACNRVGVAKFFDLNSSTGYADKRHPVTEEEFWDGEPYQAYYGYGWMRRYREKLLEHVSKFSETKIYIGRGTAIYGPHDNFDLKTCHVVPALIKRILNQENPLIVWGEPDVVRDFLYVEDVVDAALTIIEKGVPMRPYNIGSGKAITIGNIVDSVLKSTGLNPKIVWDNSKPTTIPFRMVSTERIESELAYKPIFDFDQGIKITVDWYKKTHIEK